MRLHQRSSMAGVCWFRLWIVESIRPLTFFALFPTGHFHPGKVLVGSSHGQLADDAVNSHDYNNTEAFLHKV